MDFYYDDFLLNADFDEESNPFDGLPTLRQIFSQLAETDPFKGGKIQLLAIHSSDWVDPTAGFQYGDLEDHIEDLPYTHADWFDLPARIVDHHPEASDVADTIILVYIDAYDCD